MNNMIIKDLLLEVDSSRKELLFEVWGDLCSHGEAVVPGSLAGLRLHLPGD